MQFTICKIDSGVFLTEDTVRAHIQAIDSFANNVTSQDLENESVGKGVAYAYYFKYAKEENGNLVFDKNVFGKEFRQNYKIPNQNTFSSWARINGLLNDEGDKFELGEFVNYLLKSNKITFQEFVLSSLCKQWVLVDDKCTKTLMAVLYDLINKDDSQFLEMLHSYVQPNTPKEDASDKVKERYYRLLSLQQNLQKEFFESVMHRSFNPDVDEIKFARFDALKHLLKVANILEETEDKLFLTEDGEQVLEDFHKHEGRLTKYELKDYYAYNRGLENGLFDIISHDNSATYLSICPNIVREALKLAKKDIKPNIIESRPKQVISYGAPGTGKSHGVNIIINNYPSTIRTTFHPNTSYSTFVGAFKPSSSYKKVYALNNNGTTSRVFDLDTNEQLKTIQIEYKYTKQAFLKAYVQAWKLFKATYKDNVDLQPQFLVIEEINRGSCAQIFGDIFQLLDRKADFSEYPIVADEDIRRSLMSDDTEEDTSFGKYGLQLSLRQRCAINKIYDTEGKPSLHMADKICNGEVLALPSNFFIYATMNTSDQSLFPMDGAFKRRWKWEYVPIDYTDASSFVIKLNDQLSYPWDEFLMRINKKIAFDLHSGAKQLGNRFVNPDTKVISLDEFVNKVVFYLFNDVYKNEDTFGLYFFNKDENSDEVMLFENIFDYSQDQVSLCKNFIERLTDDINIDDYLRFKANRQE